MCVQDERSADSHSLASLAGHWRRAVDLAFSECRESQPPAQASENTADALDDDEVGRLRASYIRNDVRSMSKRCGFSSDLDAARLIENVLKMQGAAAEDNAALSR